MSITYLISQWSLDENININESIKLQRLATVPFLLNLASLSPMLLKALTSDISQICKCYEIN